MSETKKSTVGFWVAIGMLLMLLFGSFLVNIGLFAAFFAGGAGEMEDRPMDASPDLREVWSSGYGTTKVVRISLEGVIMRGRQDRLFGSDPDMVESILSQIRVATKDEEVRAIILEVDSPGGAVTPSDEIYAALKNFKHADEDRIVVTFVRGLCASGGYYAAMASDYIVAEPTAIVGSVGVIMQTLNMKGLGDKLGLQSVTIASGKNKDMLNPLDDVNPEHKKLLQTMIDEMQDRFAFIVQQSRGFESRELLDGRVFTAPTALQYAFIDSIGYWGDAVRKTAEFLDVDDVRVIRYRAPKGFLENFMEAKGPQMPAFMMTDKPRFLYLWNH